MRRKTWLIWTAWAATTAIMASYMTSLWRGPDRSAFLPGATTHGHYQIELRCDACHTPWNGVKENACYDCHAEDLRLGHDSHPKSKFTDPRNADRLSSIDASNCVTCHKEHAPERTHAMGVTVPSDYCYHCHQQTLQDRPSHRDFPFDSCATAGCHNYHDNTALYEDFILKHLNEPDLKPDPQVPGRSLVSSVHPRLEIAAMNAPPAVQTTPVILHEWESTAHARAGINCTDCHMIQQPDSTAKVWSDTLTHTVCSSCHAEEASGFLSGRHGMRLAQDLSPMRPGMARLPMKPDAAHKELTCTSCHDSHSFDTRKAAVDACLTCHNDSHSLAYKDSPHFELWNRELNGGSPNSGVNCATCHLPREEHTSGGVARVLVQHNQNANLRPNEKMVRSVCLQCHGLQFTLDSLADSDLIRSNFHGRPALSLETLKLVEQRSRETKKN